MTNDNTVTPSTISTEISVPTTEPIVIPEDITLEPSEELAIAKSKRPGFGITYWQDDEGRLRAYLVGKRIETGTTMSVNPINWVWD